MTRNINSETARNAFTSHERDYPMDYRTIQAHVASARAMQSDAVWNLFRRIFGGHQTSDAGLVGARAR